VRDYADMPIRARLLDAQDTRANRPEQAVIEARVEPVALSPDVDPKFLELMDRLRAAMLVRVDDLRGFELLSRNEAALGNFVAAHRAQERVIEIKGADADAADYASYGDMLVLAADGYVSPDAEAALSKALQMDGENGTARYYIGLMFAQTGRPDLAFNLWNSLLEESSPEAPWVPPIRRQIEFAAADAGIRYQLPDAGSGPSAADIAAVQDLIQEDQNVLIRSMVTRLSDRLAREGGEPLDWARLISALGVLGETERAAAIWDEAQTVFAASPEAMATVRAAAVRAGLAN
ncbi:MAG: tetratricopeptide repeat protein, partial [Paracoccaceae bacterium]